MKRLIFGTFPASGLLFARHQPKLSGDDVIALESSSPRVHIAKAQDRRDEGNEQVMTGRRGETVRSTPCMHSFQWVSGHSSGVIPLGVMPHSSPLGFMEN